MMFASRMMCALRHIGQTSHHCGTQWSNIIFAKQMHHIAAGDASFKDHLFEVKNDSLFKDGKEIKLIRSVKIYRYKKFLYMETSHSMFTVNNTDFVSGDRDSFLSWAKSCDIRILRGY